MSNRSRIKIISSEHRATLDKIADVIAGEKVIASAIETVMDKEYIEHHRHDWCWVGPTITSEQVGWHKIDREHDRLMNVDRAEAEKLEWHERLFVYESAMAAARENSSLALYIGDEYPDGRLSALYLCGPDYRAWVAQKFA